jgi:parallel beta-helix repeat protein
MKRKAGKASQLLFTILLIDILIVFNVQAVQLVNKVNEKNVIIVDINGKGDYFSIQDAINNAQKGSKIYITKGEYREILDIRKQIELIGEDKDLTLINPFSKTNKFAIHIGAENVKIKDLSIKNRGPGLYSSAIRITASNTEIYDCNIIDTPVGIAIWTSDNIIENCYFKGCKDEGIALIGTSYSDCINNEITNCIFEKNCDGIELQYSSRNIIDNCEFYDNTHSGIDAIASSNNENIITNCEIYNNDVYGIYLASSSHNQIKDCIISNNKDGNIVINKNSHSNEIKNIVYSEVVNEEEKEVDSHSRLNPFSIIFLQRFSRLISMLRSNFNFYLHF